MGILAFFYQCYIKMSNALVNSTERILLFDIFMDRRVIDTNVPSDIILRALSFICACLCVIFKR